MKIALLLRPAAASLFVLASCRGPEPAPPPAPIDIAKSDASRAEPAGGYAADASGVNADGASGSRTTSDAPRPVDAPPAGMFAITRVDRANTCADARAPSPSSPPLVVAMKPTQDGRISANLPVNTGVGSPAIDRQDVVLELGRIERSVIRPDRTCAYEVSREIRIVDVSPTKIIANVRSEYTDAVRCTLPRKPVACKQDVELTYTLTRPLCAPGCVAAPIPLRDGGVDARCTCDAGAP